MFNYYSTGRLCTKTFKIIVECQVVYYAKEIKMKTTKYTSLSYSALKMGRNLHEFHRRIVPSSKGKDTVFVVENQFKKYAHLMVIKKTNNAKQITNALCKWVGAR